MLTSRTWEQIDHFTVVFTVTWPLDGSKAGVDLILIQYRPHCFCCVKQVVLMLIRGCDLHDKSSGVCIKTKSTPASLPPRGQVTEQTTVKWYIAKIISVSRLNFSRLLLSLARGGGGRNSGYSVSYWTLLNYSNFAELFQIPCHSELKPFPSDFHLLFERFNNQQLSTGLFQIAPPF